MTDAAIGHWIEAIRAARASGQALAIRGGGTKRLLGGPEVGTPLEVAGHTGIVAYEPTELVVTVRTGTTVADLEAALAAHGQCLAFEPPRYGSGGTVGGMVAAGLAGPSRMRAGAVRDHVLGVRMVSGHGELLSFGGQVMKNVAGYDVSRALAGSMGILGLLVEVSLRVVPEPRAVATRAYELDLPAALARLARLARDPVPLSASSWHDGRLLVRLAGSEVAVAAAGRALGGELVAHEVASDHWNAVRDHRHPFLARPGTLWRLSLPPTTPAVDLPGESLIEWHGGLRWWRTEADGAQVRALAGRLGGHAFAFRGARESADATAALDPATLRLNRALKAAFDPAGILNPGRLHPEV